MLSFAAIASSLSAQIVSTPVTATGTAGTLTCSLANPDSSHVTVTCLAKGVSEGTLTWELNNGADRSGTEVADGNTVGFAASMSNNVIHWSMSVKPNGGALTGASGLFGATPPAEPAALGTLVNGVCQPQGTGFHVDGTVLVSNEVQGNCLL